MDLSEWDFEKMGIITLDGDWEFYWNQLLEPGDFNSGVQSTSPLLVKVPEVWNGIRWEGEPLPSRGYATYRLTIQLKDLNTIHAVKMLTVATSYKLWVDGELLLNNGEVGDTAEKAKPQFLPLTAAFRPKRHMVEFVLQVSNFSHNKGGVWKPIELGIEEQIHKRRFVLIAYDMFLAGCILMMAMYHFFIYLLRKKDRTPLFFGILCLVLSVRILGVGENLLSYFVPAVSWELQQKTVLLSFYLAMPLFVNYFSLLYPREFPLLFRKSATVIGVGFSLLVVFTPPWTSWQTVIVYELITVIAGLYVFYGLFRASRSGRDGAVLAICCYFVLFLTMINDILYDNQIVQTMDLVPLGLVTFILAQSFILSHQSAKAYLMVEKQKGELEAFADQLEEKVEARTAELKKAQKELVKEAHKVGMAEISISVLHNMGNYFNTINVTTQIIRETLDRREFKNLQSATELLEKHMNNLEAFVLRDPRGKKLLEYFIILSKGFQEREAKLKQNVHHVEEKVELIKNLIATQERYVGIETLTEVVQPNKTIQDVLTISESALNQSEMIVTTKFNDVPEIRVHKTKFVFIVSSLIQNASEAMVDNRQRKELMVITEQKDDGVLVKFQDTGHGIQEGLLEKIFFQGFSTKNHRLGFGLHTCAIYMEEIGGKIWADSPVGIKGATFFLWFPNSDK